MIVEICKKEKCTACNACMLVCPKQCIFMQPDEYGSLYPKIDYGECIDCKLCIKTCPNNRTLDFRMSRKVLAAWSNCKSLRLSSASGGIASEIYKYFLKKGDEGYSVGVKLDENFEAVFIPILNLQDLELVQNSKYVYSNTLDIYHIIKEQLNIGKSTLFIGLPCQVAGLLSYLKVDYDKLTTVDLVCHGVAPTEYLKKHLLEIEKRTNKRITKLSFRDPNYNTCSYTFSLKDATHVFYKRRADEDDVYQLGYHNALIYRENCYNCQYAQRMRISDLTLCDFSGIGKYSSFEYDKDNVSCILVNSDKGQKLLDDLENEITLVERPACEAYDFEPQLNAPYKRHPQRGVFLNQFSKNGDFDWAAAQALEKELANYIFCKSLKGQIVLVKERIAKKVKREALKLFRRKKY